MPAEKTQPFCPCSRVLNWTGKGLIPCFSPTSPTDEYPTTREGQNGIFWMNYTSEIGNCWDQDKWLWTTVYGHNASAFYDICCVNLRFVLSADLICSLYRSQEKASGFITKRNGNWRHRQSEVDSCLLEFIYLHLCIHTSIQSILQRAISILNSKFELYWIGFPPACPRHSCSYTAHSSILFLIIRQQVWHEFGCNAMHAQIFGKNFMALFLRYSLLQLPLELSNDDLNGWLHELLEHYRQFSTLMAVPNAGHHQTEVRPSLKRFHHSYVWVLHMASSPNAIFNISNVSVTDFPIFT